MAMGIGAWLALLCAAEVQAAAPVVAVFGLRDATGILSEPDRSQLTRYMAAQLAAGGRFLVVPEADLARALQEKKAESYRECYDEACQIEIGRELAANKSLVTEVVKLGSACALVATLYDLQRSTTEQATTMKGPCAVDELVSAMERAAKVLRGEGSGVAAGAQPPRLESVVAPRPGVALSASHLHFLTREGGRQFSVKILAPDGRTHECGEAVTLSKACELEALAIGEARLFVTEGELSPFDDTFDVEPKNHTKTFLVEERASEGSIIAWSLGGLAAATGVALFSVGVGVDNSGMVYAGIPATVVGAGVLALGFFFGGKIAVDESVLDLD